MISYFRTANLNAYLHRNWEIVLSLWWEENIYSFFLEWSVACWWGSHLNDVKFTSLGAADGETEEGRLGGVTRHLKLCKSGGVSLDRLGNFTFNTVQLHSSYNAVLLLLRRLQNGTQYQ